MNSKYCIWLVFDLNNGDSSKRYCWWFNTREEARRHIRWQRKQKYSAKLSSPVKCLVLLEDITKPLFLFLSNKTPTLKG
jgi:hypothetical protein